MPLPIVAAGFSLVSGFIKKGGIKKVFNFGKKAGGFIGGLFKKKKKRSEKAQSDSLLYQPGPVSQTSIPPNLLVPDDKKKPGDLADTVNDWLGRATKDTRVVTTAVDNKTLLYLGAGLVAAFILFRK